MNLRTAIHSPARLVTLLLFLVSSCLGHPSASPAPSRPPPSRTAPRATIAPPTSPADVLLSELTPEVANVGFGALGVGFYNTPDDDGHNGHPIRSRGIAYPHGLMAHAPSEIEYRLDGQFRIFTTRILAQDDLSCGDGVVFRVYLDNLEVYVSPRVRYDDQPSTVVLDVAGASLLTMIVDPRQGSDCDWAIWGDPFLTPATQMAEAYPTRTPRPTPTLGPEAPCGPNGPEAVFVFLDCKDVRRIRTEIYSNSATSREWRILLQGVKDFVATLPRTYSPDDSPAWMWLDFMPRNMGLVYLITGDPKVGDAIRDLLRTVRDGTPSPVHEVGRPESGLMVQPGSFTSAHISMLFAFATIRNTARVTDEERRSFDDYFLEQAKRLDGFTSWVDSLRTDIWNTYIQADAAIASIALTQPDNDRARYLYNRARQRIEFRIARWYDADGGWREYTDNYSPLVLQPLLLWAETEFHAGNDVYGHSFGGKTVHTICKWYLEVMTPQGVLPAIGDGHWLQSLDPGLLHLCAMRTADPSLEFAFEEYLAGRDRWPSRSFKLQYLFDTIAWSDASLSSREPSWLSQLLPDSGLAVLRSSWSRDSQYILLEFMDDDLPHKMHMHQSFGNVVLYDGGSWILENGYRAKSEEEYSRSVSTADHSSLTLDNQSQINTRASESFFAAPGSVAIASATSRTYPKLTHTRTVLWSEMWHQWVVVDDAALNPPAAVHNLQLRWYVSLPDAQHPIQIDHSEQLDTAHWNFTRTWGIPGTLAIDLLPALPATFNSISRVYIDPWEGRATGVEMETTPPSWPVRLVSVLTSHLQGGVPPSGILRNDTKQATIVTSRRPNGQWDWILPRSPKALSEVDRYTVVGRAACRESSGETTTTYCLLGGMNFEMDGASLFSSTTPLSAHIDLVNGRVYVDAQDNVAISFFWPSTIVEIVDEAGTPVSFSVSGSNVSIDVVQGNHVYAIR